MKKVITYCGGRAKGNPGPAAIGVYIVDEAGAMLKEVSETIGNSTDNFAGYQSVMRGLQTLLDIYGKETNEMKFELRLDSELVKKQLNSEYEVNEPGLVPMFIEIHNMRVSSFPNLTLTYIERELNQEVDRLVNKALDS